MIRSIVFVVALLGTTEALAESTFETCAKDVTARPAEYESYRCYYEVAGRSGDWQAAAKHLERLAVAHPQVDWIVFVRALVAGPVDSNAAEPLYVEAARRFRAAGNVRGEMLARANLQVMFYESRRLASAGREVERVAELGKLAQDPELRIRASLVEAQFLISTGTDLGRAHRALKRAESELEGHPTYWLRHHVLHDLGRVLLLTGEYDQAATYFRRLQDEASAQQDIGTAARARLDVINTLLEKRGEEPGSVDMARLVTEAEGALAAARRARDLDLELDALRMLGEATLTDHPQVALGYVDACVSQARKAQRPQLLSHCLWIKARLLADQEPLAAQQAVDAAIGQLRSDEGVDHRLLAYAWRNAMRVAWRIQPADAAIGTGTRALTAIEGLRDLQPGLESRAAAFSTWTQDYYWLSGQILRLVASDANDELARSRLEAAFQIGERIRSRSLLDRLRSPSLAAVARDDMANQERQVVLESIADLNRQLLRAPESTRQELENTLEALERQELDTREVRDVRPAAVGSVSLAELQRTLAPNEALLSFQVGLDTNPNDRFAGGAWLFVVTREQTRVIQLPDRRALSQSIALFAGLMHQTAAQRQPAAIALYDQLLAEALSRLPAQVERLIVVPDSPLDSLPLAALGAAPSTASERFEPLAARFELVLAPSATLWHDWRTHVPDSRPASLLVIADPHVDFADAAISAERSWMQDATLSLGALPHARAEGRQIIEQVGGRGTLWIGDVASEGAFKAADLSHHSVLHFAAHTVIDGAHPDRSAILLASGASREDGLLQSREIADLRLDGQLVVLSSCQSATGTHVRGEGVLGLARSFFASGARAVVGSLWPVRDDQARVFFERFYTFLAQGDSAGGALHKTQRALIEKGFPAETWAGFVLMGDASVTPVSKIENAATQPRMWLVLAIGALVAAAIAASRRKLRS